MNETELKLARLRRKRDQEWDMAGLARVDGDKADEARHTALARQYAEEIGRLLKEQPHDHT